MVAGVVVLTLPLAAVETDDPVMVAEAAVGEWAVAATERPREPGVFAEGGPQWAQITTDLDEGVGTTKVGARTDRAGLLTRDKRRVVVGWVGSLTHHDDTRRMGLEISLVASGEGWKVWSMGERPPSTVEQALKEASPRESQTGSPTEVAAASAVGGSSMSGAMWAGLSVLVIVSLFGVALTVPAMLDRRGHR